MAPPHPTRVPIARLRPELESAPDTSVHGVVTLVWPYASSTESLSLLLVEPDFRLRRQQGQVRIRFEGSSARAVAKTGVGSGDELVLSLQGASWGKDPTTANTPGRGIEWELEYGERVVLEIQRSGKDPISLDIDHPSPSPEPARTASSPLRSPSHNSHIPTSTRKHGFASISEGNDTWSSPAFSKSRHFAPSSYDPFAEVDDEFPDNVRRKRTKFGRGSGKWKFVGNTPSPEKEIEEDASRRASSSPLGAMERDAGQDVEEQVMLATPPMDVVAHLPEEDGFSAMKTATSAGEAQELASEPAGLIKVDTLNSGKTNSSPFCEDITIDHSDQLYPMDGQVDHFANAEASELATAENAAQASLRESRSSGASPRSPFRNVKSDGEGEGSLRDSASDAVWSGKTSEFGLDGAVMSRLRRVSEVAPMASEIGRRWVEMQEAAVNLERTGDFVRPISKNIQTVDQASAADSKIGTQHGLQTDDGSVQLGQQHEKDAQQQSNLPLAEREQELDTAESVPQESLNVDDEASDERKEDAKAVRAVNTDEVQANNSESAGKTLRDETLQLQIFNEDARESKPGELVTTEKIAQQEPVDGEKSGDDKARGNKPTEEDLVGVTSSLPATGHGSTAPPISAAAELPPISRVDLVNLESDNEDDRQYLPLARQGAPISLRSSMAEDEWAERSKHFENVAQQVDDAQEESELLVNKDVIQVEGDVDEDEGDLEGAKAALNAKEERIPSFRQDGDAVLVEEPSFDPAPITDDLPTPERSLESHAYGGMDVDINYPPQPTQSDGQDLLVGVEPLFPRPRLPSTVQDTFEGPITSQLLASDNTQRTDSMTQPSSLSMLSAPDGETLETPELTRGTSTEILIPEPEEQAEPMNDSVRRKTVEAAQPKKPAQEGAERPRTRAAAARVMRSPEPSAPRAVGQLVSAGKGSSLIARLREMRRRSSETSEKRLSSSSTTPWFKPRRSSQTVLDSEAGSVAHVKSQGKSERSASITPTKVTPEKTDKRLSQSFIRSSPLQSPPLKSPNLSLHESQYLPHSQPATGFRTSLSYFVPLASLHNHYGTAVDVLTVVISITNIIKAKTGRRDYTQTMYLTDPSSGPNNKTVPFTIAQIFRPSKDCFPRIALGDAILLRNFKVQSYQKRLSLISTESSGWAVFRKDADVQIRGPPVEYGPEERAFARGQWSWWASLTEGQRDDIAASIPKAKVGTAKRELTRKGLGFELPSLQKKGSEQSKLTNENLVVSFQERSLGSDGSAEPDDVKEAEVAAGGRVLRSRNSRARASASPEKNVVPKIEEIHELRDGTRYVDRDGVDAEQVETQTGVHELRDGTRYRDQVRK